ncbi:unnamed protein product [Periconia digitata]|uniref:Uncharacterized protein n=1 Tax=Periconia digitata TaxID=1303443 RepID=A0A9W4UJH4_9PLEO|nr:unnamed protein product [Periconia digitata]
MTLTSISPYSLPVRSPNSVSFLCLLLLVLHCVSCAQLSPLSSQQKNLSLISPARLSCPTVGHSTYRSFRRNCQFCCRTQLPPQSRFHDSYCHCMELCLCDCQTSCHYCRILCWYLEQICCRTRHRPQFLMRLVSYEVMWSKDGRGVNASTGHMSCLGTHQIGKYHDLPSKHSSPHGRSAYCLQPRRCSQQISDGEACRGYQVFDTPHQVVSSFVTIYSDYTYYVRAQDCRR